MKPDLDKYRAMLPENNSSKEEQDDVLLALWSAMEAIVDRAFNEHPSQQISHESLKKFADKNPDLIE